MKKPKKSGAHAKAVKARTRPKVPRWALIGLVLIALIAGATRYTWLRRTAPPPPAIALEGLDRAVANQVTQALHEVRSAPRSDKAWGKLGLVLQASDFKAEARLCFAHAEGFNGSEPRWPYYHGLLLAQDAPEDAAKNFGRAAELSRDKPDTARLRLAQLLAERGHLEEAGGHFKQLLRANPNHGPALLGLGRLSFTQGKLQESTDYLRRCLEDPHVAKSAYLLLSTVQGKLGNVPAAERAAGIAAEVPADQPWPDPYAREASEFQIARQTLVDRGLQMVKHGRLDEALPLVTRLIKEYPDDPEAWLLFGRLRLQQQDCKTAEQAAQRHLALTPNSVNGYAQLGMALLCLERYPDAAACFQKAVELKPDFGEAHFNRGFALARMGQGDEAIQSFREAIRTTPNFVDSYITLADLLSQRGHKEEALALLNQALQLNPADERAKALMERVRQR